MVFWKKRISLHEVQLLQIMEITALHWKRRDQQALISFMDSTISSAFMAGILLKETFREPESGTAIQSLEAEEEHPVISIIRR